MNKCELTISGKGVSGGNVTYDPYYLVYGDVKGMTFVGSWAQDFNGSQASMEDSNGTVSGLSNEQLVHNELNKEKKTRSHGGNDKVKPAFSISNSILLLYLIRGII